MEKLHTLTAALMPAATNITNMRLRRGSYGTDLVVVGHPPRMDSLLGRRPLCGFGEGDMLCADGKTLSLCRHDGAASVTLDNPLDAALLCGAGASAHATIMTSAGPLTVDAAESGAPQVSAAADYPAISLLAVEGGVVAAAVSPRTLAKGGGSTVADADRRSLCSDLEDAYRELCRQSAASGTAIQPALARYRLYDSGGHELYVSPAVLVCASDGAQCTQAVELQSSDRLTVEGYTLTAATWRLEVRLPASDSRVARADIFLSPLFHPYRRGASAVFALGRSGSRPFARVGLPGGGAVSPTAVCQILERLDAAERRVASIAMPFSRSESIIISPGSSSDPDDDVRALDRALAKSAPAAATLAQVLTSAPHRFSARISAEGSGTTAWGDITIHRAQPYSILNFASTIGSGEWRAVSIVEFADGSGTVRSESGTDGAPVLFNPVFSYPSPDAVRLTVLLYAGGRNYKGVYALRAACGGRCAVHISGALRPSQLPESFAAQIVDVASPQEHFPSMLLFAPTDSPLSPQCITMLPSPPRSLLARPASAQSWDFGRCRFVAATADGVYSLSLNSSRSVAALRSLDSAGSTRGDALAADGSGNVYIASGQLLRLAENGRRTVVDSDRCWVAAAYCREYEELWALAADGTVKVFTPQGSYSRTDIRPVEFVSVGGEFYALGPYPCRPSDEMPAESTEISFDMPLVARRYQRFEPCGLRLSVHASSFDGHVSVSGTGVGGGAPFAIRTAGIKGAVRGTIAYTFVSRPVCALSVSVKARVSADFTLNNIHIRCR